MYILISILLVGFLFKWRADYVFGAGLLIYLFIPIFVIFHRENWADLFGIYAFSFLAVGVLLYIIKLINDSTKD